MITHDRIDVEDVLLEKLEKFDDQKAMVEMLETQLAGAKAVVEKSQAELDKLKASLGSISVFDAQPYDEKIREELGKMKGKTGLIFGKKPVGSWPEFRSKGATDSQIKAYMQCFYQHGVIRTEFGKAARMFWHFGLGSVERVIVTGEGDVLGTIRRAMKIPAPVAKPASSKKPKKKVAKKKAKKKKASKKKAAKLRQTKIPGVEDAKSPATVASGGAG